MNNFRKALIFRGFLWTDNKIKIKSPACCLFLGTFSVYGSFQGERFLRTIKYTKTPASLNRVISLYKTEKAHIRFL